MFTLTPNEHPDHSPNLYYYSRPCSQPFHPACLSRLALRTVRSHPFIYSPLDMPTVHVDFSNTGDGVIRIDYDNPNGSTANSIYVAKNQIVRKEMDIEYSYYFKFTQGRREQATT